MTTLLSIKRNILKTTYVVVFALAAVTQSCRKDEPNETPPPQEAPVAGFSWTGTQSAPAEITFTNTSKYADSYKWDFGNSETSVKQQPDKVVFSEPGNYDILLTASKGTKSSVLKKTIIIAANADPAAHFSYSFKDGKTSAPTEIILVNESVNADSYAWDINGFATTAQTPPDIRFRTPGDFKIRLTAVKGNKSSPVYEETVTITQTEEPQARFVLPYHPFPYQVGEEIQLVNQSLNSDAWEWSFGANGPQPSTAENPVVKFTSAGTYPITLVAKRGTVSSAPKTINIKIG